MSDLLATITHELHVMDPDLTPVSPGFAEAVVLVASIFLGADEARISAELQYDSEFVHVIGSRLRSAEVWDGDDLAQEHRDAWTDEEKGGIAFWLDVGVAEGKLVARTTDGEPRYSVTPSGRQHVENMLRRTDDPDTDDQK